MAIVGYVGVAVVAYLLGSFPTGYLVARARGVDIRQAGSGNIGATNVLRVLGKPTGILVLVIDALKGAMACGLLPRLAVPLLDSTAPLDAEAAAMVAGLAAILGHNYTCWLRFKGGKGIATSAGVLLVWMPRALGLALVVWGLTFALTRYVSLASIVAALTLPLVVWLTGGSGVWIGLAAVLAAMALYKHRANIQRLRAGTEHRFVRRKREPPTSR